MLYSDLLYFFKEREREREREREKGHIFVVYYDVKQYKRSQRVKKNKYERYRRTPRCV